MSKEVKRRGQARKTRKKKPSPLDKKTIQRITAKALLSLVKTPDTVGTKRVIDPEVGYQLVLAAANQTILHYRGANFPPDMKPATEMGVDVEYDPTLKKTENRYNFSSSKFTIYTPENLTEVISQGERKITKEESLRNALSESIPSAQFRLFYIQAVLMSQGNQDLYKDRYLPNQFRKSRKAKTREKK